MTRPPKPRALDWYALAVGGLHPIKVAILEHLAETGNAPATPGGMAIEFKKSLGVVSYHVRQLADPDVFEHPLLELVRTEPRRGALQHFYKATDTALLSHGQAARRAMQRSMSRIAGGHVEFTRETVAKAIHESIAQHNTGGSSPTWEDSSPDYRKLMVRVGDDLLRGVAGA